MGHIYRKGFLWKSMTAWDRELDEATNTFKRRFGLFPNICLANSPTYMKIELVANLHKNREQMHDDAGETPPPALFAPLAGFLTDSCEIEFCLDDSLEDLRFILLHDSDPDGGGEDDEIVDDDLPDHQASDESARSV